jgi:predicted neutral ceramidase superfamily lipid hydrolase
MRPSFVRDYDATLNGQITHTMQMRRSYMYEFIMLFIISAIVLSITVRNMTSSTVTMGGYIICCIIIVLFVSAVIVYVVHFFGLNTDELASMAPADEPSARDGGGPIIRIQYV